jgi:hypothetical protein
MKKVMLFLVFGALMSCKQSFVEADLQHLNGYWEIEKVVLPDGDKKEYKVNETIDFFKIDQNKGFRKKVMPQIDGTYLTNNIQETVKVELIDGTASIHYSTSYAQWKEEIIELSKDKLVIKNQQDLEYHYKRPVKFSIK